MAPFLSTLGLTDHLTKARVAELAFIFVFSAINTFLWCAIIWWLSNTLVVYAGVGIFSVSFIAFGLIFGSESD